MNEFRGTVGGASILVVEDEVIIAMDLKSRLKTLGYQVSAIVCSGEEAILQAASNRPKLVLMDVSLRGNMDGIQAAGVINQKFGIPVVFVTANSDSCTHQRARETNPSGFVIKPFAQQELRAAIADALNKQGPSSNL